MTGKARRDGNPYQIGIREGMLYFLLPLVIAVATGGKLLAGVIAGGLVNPDSYMRLVRIEETLRQHSPAYIVSNDGSGAGTLLHWSHLLDCLLCLLAAPFDLLMDPNAALHTAAIVFGPLCMGGLGLALAWAAAPLAERRWLWLAPTAAALATPIVSYGLPGVVHHHVLLVLVAVMTSGYALRSALGVAGTWTGLRMGAWAAVGIWLSPETMPFSLMAFGAVWIAWLLAPERQDIGPVVRTAGIGFLLVIAGSFAVDPPYAGYAAVEIDRLSIVYLALALLLCAMGLASLAIDRGHLRATTRITTALAVPILCLGIWIGLFPAIMLGSDGLLSAKDTHALFGGITEMMPIAGTAEAVAFLLPGMIAAVALAWFSLSRRSLLLGYAMLCSLALLAIGALHIRFAAYSSAAAAVMFPILITRCSASLADWSEIAQAGARVALMALFALVPRVDAVLPGLFSPAKAATTKDAPTCAVSDLGTILAPYAGQVVLTSPNDSPELLYRTQMRTVGSLYHRNISAFMRLRAAWRSSPANTVPDAVRATGATVILFCHFTARSLLVADLPQETLLDRLNRGEIPPWLRKVAADPQSGNVLYEVLQ
jgi:hypothetical protein